MKTALRPIVHRKSYTRLVKGPIEEFFREAIFQPLLDMLADENVKANPKDQRINEDVLTYFPSNFGGLNRARGSMPQINGDDHDKLITFLSDQGIRSESITAMPKRFRPSQSGYYAKKVEAARKFKGDREIIVSSDDYIVDGHHQWMSALVYAPRRPINAIRFLCPIVELLARIDNFNGVERRNAGPEIRETGTQRIVRALREGTLWYVAGAFGGTFNAAISRELRQMGATFDAANKVFKINPDKLPITISGPITDSASKMRDLTKRMVDTITQMEMNVPRAATGINLEPELREVIGGLNEQFDQTTKAARDAEATPDIIPGPKPSKYSPADPLDIEIELPLEVQSPANALDSISVPAEMNDSIAKGIAKEYTENIDLYVKDFAAQELPKLREMVQENALNGGRADKLAKIIEKRYGVSKRKAEFLASQETSLLISKYREQRYKGIGVRRYRWSTSHDERVREDHRLLNGQVFAFDDPPITDRATGFRGNPGEPYGCRCVAIPILSVETR